MTRVAWMLSLTLAATAATIVLPAAAETEAPCPCDKPPFTQVHLLAEFGTLGVLTHTFQSGKNGTKFDYVDEGGQDTLLPFGRVSAELELDGRHTIVLLYQPLQIQTQAILRRDVLIDEEYFYSGTPVSLRYGFDFYRLSYLYDFFGDQKDQELGLGLSMQIRNAVIRFTSEDGRTRKTFSDIGPVPTIKLRGRYTWESGVWLGGEFDGMYAPVKYLNGGASDVEGAIIDLSGRVGYRVVKSMDLFLNLRWIGGGASGTSKSKDEEGDGYVSNWLNFLSASLGVIWTPTDLL